TCIEWTSRRALQVRLQLIPLWSQARLTLIRASSLEVSTDTLCAQFHWGRKAPRLKVSIPMCSLFLRVTHLRLRIQVLQALHPQPVEGFRYSLLPTPRTTSPATTSFARPIPISPKRTG